MAISRQDRARQFLPFDALTGFQELLRQKEVEIEERKNLTEESYNELEEKLNSVDIGNEIGICYYSNYKYINISGILKKIDYSKKKILLDDIFINIKDIVDIVIS